MGAPTIPHGPFVEALRLWKLRIVEWLGLDPREVIEVLWNPNTRIPMPVEVSMLAEAKSRPTRGLNDGLDYRGDGMAVRYVRLTPDEHADLLGHAGPMPDFRTMQRDQERADLRERFLTVLDAHTTAGDPAYLADLLIEELD